MGGRMGGYPEGPTGIYMGGQVSNLTNGQIGGPMSSYMNSGAPNGWQQAGTEQNWQRVHGQGQGGSQFSAQMGENPQTNGQMFTGPMNAPNAQTPNGRSGILPRNISATLLGEGEADEPPILEGVQSASSHIIMKACTSLRYSRPAEVARCRIAENHCRDILLSSLSFSVAHHPLSLRSFYLTLALTIKGADGKCTPVCRARHQL
eukprot:6191611-Pleurochrysis_carterae.AAC.2